MIQGSDRTDISALTAEEAVRAELRKAQAVLVTQTALARAVASGVNAAALQPLIQAQAEAVDAAIRAARQRAAVLADPASVERWIQSEPAKSSERRKLLEDGRHLRREIDVAARRGTYLAGRIALWNETLRAWIVEAVLRESRAEGYGSVASGGLAAALDRTV